MEVDAANVLVFGAYGIYFDPDCQDAITVNQINAFRTCEPSLLGLAALRMLRNSVAVNGNDPKVHSAQIAPIHPQYSMYTLSANYSIHTDNSAFPFKPKPTMGIDLSVTARKNV